MQKIELIGNNYELIKNDKDCFNYEEIKDKVTEYFEDFDYIFGDYAYEKVRLKGYYDNNNAKATDINKIDSLDTYIENYCSYGAKTFLLKKMK